MIVGMMKRTLLVSLLTSILLIPAVHAFSQESELPMDERVDFLMFEASLALESGRTGEAVSTLAQVIQLAPDRQDARLLYAQALTRGLQEDIFEDVEAAAALALSQYQWVRDHDPENREARVGIEYLTARYFRTPPSPLQTEEGKEAWNRAETALKEDDVPRAIEALEDAVKAEPKAARVHRILGDLYLENGDTDKALKAYEKAGKLNPEDARIPYGRGSAYEQKGKTDKALESYAEAMDLDDAFRPTVKRILAILEPRARDDMSTENLELLGRAYLSDGRYDEAVETLEKIPERRAGEKTWKAMGIAEFFRQNDMRCLELLERASEKNPEDLEVLYYQGASHLRQNHVEEGRAVLRKVLEKDPVNPNAMRLLGLSLAEDPDKAQEAADLLLQAHAAGARINSFPCILGTLYMRLGRSDAPRYFEECLEIDPHFPGAYLGLGILADDRGDTREAIRYLEDYMDLSEDPDRAAVFRLGVAYLRSGQDQRGFTTLRKVVQVDPDAAPGDSTALSDTEILEATSFFLATVRRFEDAVFVGEMLLTKDPANAIYNNNLAMTYADADIELGRAHTLAQKANNLSKDNPGHLDTLGWTLVRMGRLDEAEETLDRAMRLAEEQGMTQLSEVHYHFGVLYGKQGRHQDAVDALTRALEDPPSPFLRLEIERLLDREKQEAQNR